jgi:hypothetical protein
MLRHHAHFRTRLLPAALVVLGACTEKLPSLATPAIAAPAPVAARASARLGPELAAVRKATEKYRDPAVALAEGYIDEKLCVAMPGVGAMGVHFIQPRLMGMQMVNGRVHGTDTEIDPTKPEILVYEPRKDGKLELVAVEWYTSQEAWGSRPHPTIFGVPFNTMQDDPATPDVDEGHMFTPHYDLHLWLYKDNPNGAFAQWNPKVTCPADAAPAHGKH